MKLFRSKVFLACSVTAVATLIVSGVAWAAYVVPKIDPAPNDKWYACVSSVGKVKPATMKFNVQPANCPAATDTIRWWAAQGPVGPPGAPGVNNVHVLNLALPETGGSISYGDGSCAPGDASSARCHPVIAAGVVVRLTATPPTNDPGQPPYVFDHWTGDCSGTAATCDLVMDGSKTVGFTVELGDPNSTNPAACSAQNVVGGPPTISDVALTPSVWSSTPANSALTIDFQSACGIAASSIRFHGTISNCPTIELGHILFAFNMGIAPSGINLIEGGCNTRTGLPNPNPMDTKTATGSVTNLSAGTWTNGTLRFVLLAYCNVTYDPRVVASVTLTDWAGRTTTMSFAEIAAAFPDSIASCA